MKRKISDANYLCHQCADEIGWNSLYDSVENVVKQAIIELKGGE